MADNENIGGISVEIVGDYAPLAADLQEAQKVAAEAGKDIAGAFTDAAEGADKLGAAVAGAVSGVDEFEQKIQSLVDSGHTLAEALAQVEGESATLNEGLASAGESAATAAEQMSLFDEAVSVPYADAAGQLNLFATELEPIPAAAGDAAEGLKGVGAAAGEAGSAAGGAAPEVQDAAISLEQLAEAAIALLAVKEVIDVIKETAMASLEAADAVDDATQAMQMLSGAADAAAVPVEELRSIAMDDALEFPSILTAATRMTAFLGSTEKVPAIMRAVADSAAVMGTEVSSASGAFERIVSSGEISQRSLLRLGLTLGDVGKAMGVTAEEAKDAFKNLNQSQQIEVMTTALGKFNGAAKKLSDDALGGMVRMGEKWKEVLEDIGNAIGPVVKGMADFVSSNIIPLVKDLVDAFIALPEPIKMTAGAMAAASTAGVVLVGTAGSLAHLAGTLAPAFTPAVTALQNFGAAITGATASHGAMIAAGVLRATLWLALAAAILEVVGAYRALRVAQEGQKEADEARINALKQLEVGLKQHGADISALQKDYQQGIISLSQYEEALRKMARELGDTKHAQDVHKAALVETATIQDAVRIKQQLLTKAVEDSRVALMAATQHTKETGKDAELVAVAYDNWQKATKALNGEQEKHLGTLKDTAKVYKEWDQSVLNLPASLDAAAAATEQEALKLKAVWDNISGATMVLNIYTAKWREHTASAAEFLKVQDEVKKAWKELFDVMGDPPKVDLFPKAQAKENEEDLKRVSNLIENLVPKVKMLPPPITSVADAMHVLGIETEKTAEITDTRLVDAYMKASEGAKTIDDERLAWAAVSEALSKVSDIDMPKVLAAYEQHARQVAALKDTQKGQLDMQAEALQKQIEFAERSGADASAQIIALDNVKMHQQALYDQTHLLGDLYVNTQQAMIDGFMKLGTAVADFIVEGGNIIDTFEQIGKQVLKTIVEEIVNTGFKAMKDAIIGVNSDVKSTATEFQNLGKQVNSVLNSIKSSLGGIGKSGGAASGGGGTLGALDAIASLGTMISSIISNFQIAKLETTMNAVEHNTRYTEIIQEEFKRDQWDQHYALLTKLDDIWNAMLNVGDAIVSALAGAAIQVGEVVGQQIDRMPGVNRTPATAGAGGGATTYGDFTGYQIGPTYTPDISSPSSAAQVSPSMYSSSSSSSTVGGITINVNGGSTPMATARAVASELRAAIPIWTTFGT